MTPAEPEVSPAEQERRQRHLVHSSNPVVYDATLAANRAKLMKKLYLNTTIGVCLLALAGVASGYVSLGVAMVAVYLLVVRRLLCATKFSVSCVGKAHYSKSNKQWTIIKDNGFFKSDAPFTFHEDDIAAIYRLPPDHQGSTWGDRLQHKLQAEGFLRPARPQIEPKTFFVIAGNQEMLFHEKFFANPDVCQALATHPVRDEEMGGVQCYYGAQLGSLRESRIWTAVLLPLVLFDVVAPPAKVAAFVVAAAVAIPIYLLPTSYVVRLFYNKDTKMFLATRRGAATQVVLDEFTLSDVTKPPAWRTWGRPDVDLVIRVDGTDLVLRRNDFAPHMAYLYDQLEARVK